MGVWWSGAGETGGNITNVSDPGGSGNGNNQDDQNNQTGETGGHKLLDQYNQLVAEGKGGTTQAQELGRYLGRVEQKYQSGAGPGGYEGESLYPDQPQQKPSERTATEQLKYKEATFEPLNEWDKIKQLAALEAQNPKYAKSWEGQQMEAQGKGPGTPEWINKFGLPSIIAMPTYYQGDYEYEKGRDLTWDKEPIMTPSGEYIYSEQGRELMDQYGQPGFDYETAKDAYWDDRAVQEERERSLPGTYGGYGGGGGGGGGGYYGDPRRGNPVEQMAGFYTPQANLQQAMVNVHGTPTVFRKRGGIVSLLRLS